MNWIDTIYGQPFWGTSRLTAAVVAKSVVNMPKRVMLSMVRGLLNCQRDHAERAALRGMSEAMLKDIGITRGQADEMAGKPWLRRDIRKRR